MKSEHTKVKISARVRYSDEKDVAFTPRNVMKRLLILQCALDYLTVSRLETYNFFFFLLEGDVKKY